MEHTPVLKEQVVEIFNQVGETIIDATIGGGGHALAIAKAMSNGNGNARLPSTGHVGQDARIVNRLTSDVTENRNGLRNRQSITGFSIIGLDQDYSALILAAQNLKECNENITLVHGNFRNIRGILKELKVEKVNGILVDLGMSSMQLDSKERGFSFRYDSPLDMRMNVNNQETRNNNQTNSKSKITNSKPRIAEQSSPWGRQIQKFNDQFSNGLTAELIIKTWNESKIADILWEYGEERFARKIAKAIRENRQDINTTEDLAQLCEKCVPPRFRKYKIHPATKTFQALRIAVNDEIEALKEFLTDAPDLLAPGGRLAIISFHSLEDRLVKQKFNQLAKANNEERIKNYELVTKHPIVATEEEIVQNPRSRSAKLRVIEKVE